MAKAIVAIVGRPNVGKSLLFNRLAERKNAAIVEDTPGVTRDRIYAEAEWRGRVFDLIDTGGIEPKTDNEILRFMREQAYIAIDNADVVILVTDVKTGVTAADADVASMLKRSKKPVVLCVNKIDTPGDPPAEFYEFYNLGMGDPVGVSAMHGYGTGDLLDRCFEYFPEETDEFDNAWRIYGADGNKPADELPRNTSIQRAYADWLKKGNKAGWGYGIFLFDGQQFIRKSGTNEKK